MKRTPLRRTGFRRMGRPDGPTSQREPHPRAPTAIEDAFLRAGVEQSDKPVAKGRLVTYGGSTSGVPVPKENALQHSGYMEAVRNLGYCMLCGRACRPQFAHADKGKGTGIKTDVRLGWPGCGPGEWGPGCHYILGSTGYYTKDQRRVIEKRLGRKTRSAVKAAGTWPASLPAWSEA